MTNRIMDEALTQADVGVVLQRLKTLREQISTARRVLAPLEANLAAVEREYQDWISPLRREAGRIQVQINELHDRMRHIEGVHAQLPGNPPAVDDVVEDCDAVVARSGSASAATDPEALEKDKLLEHVYRVLEPMTNPADAELVGQLQGLLTDPMTRLAEVLERLEWGPVWETKSRQETLAVQYRRLQGWEQALADQLALLNRGAERLRKDRRYGLWQQYQKGPDAWRGFLQQVARQYQQDIDDLQAQLEALRQHWAQLVNAP